MIKLDRGKTPDLFATPLVMELKWEQQQYYSLPPATRSQTRFDYAKQSSKLFPQIRPALYHQFSHKCAYCETIADKLDVELFRPRTVATNLDGRADEDHYWWLAFEWDNYLLACKSCNALKGSRFPVDGPRCEIGSLGEILRAEKRLLLDPCLDDPQQSLLYLEDGRVSGTDARAQVTIDVVGLNRSPLVADRKKSLTAFKAIAQDLTKPATFAKAAQKLRTLVSSAGEFAAMHRQFAKSFAFDLSAGISEDVGFMEELKSGTSALGEAGQTESGAAILAETAKLDRRTRRAESFSINSKNVSEDYYRKAQFIEKIEIANIRNLKGVEFSPSIGEHGGSWFAILGENGTGKSSLLQAIACALSGQRVVNGLRLNSADFIRPGCMQGEVKVHLTGLSVPITLTFAKGAGRMTVKPESPKIIVLAYGSTRLLSRNGKGGGAPASRVNIKNIFDPLALLSDGRAWLLGLNKSDFDSFAKSISALLPPSDGSKLIRKSGEIYVQSPSRSDPIFKLSSGYQAVLALAIDIMSVMRKGWDDMLAAEGVVLIDEIDAHLHPRWKMKIVGKLRALFPRIQFIVSTHDPLTLKGLDSNEVGVMTRRVDGSVEMMTSENADLPSPRYMKVDQLLTSEYFGLSSTEDAELDGLYDEYYRLLALRAPTNDEKTRTSELRAKLDAKGQFGTSMRERILYEAADDLVAEGKNMPAKASDSDAKERLKSLWAELDVTRIEIEQRS